MVRVLLLLGVIGAMVIFAVQNLSPISLVILGAKTQALPLAIWVLGAIAAGAASTLILAGLSSIARPLSRPSAGRTTQRFSNPRSADPSPHAPWAAWANRNTPASAGSAAKSYAAAPGRGRGGDDRETAGQNDAWDDWEEQTQPDRASSAQAEIRDREDEDWANWEGYEEFDRRERREDDELDDLVDEFEDDARDDRPAYAAPQRPTRPRRTHFEAKQEPETHQQSGSVYSYSYRRSDPPPTDPPNDITDSPPIARPGEVYDAEYRVITPPYRPDPEESVDPTSDPIESERTIDPEDEADWGLEDDFDDDDEQGDRPRRKG